MPRAAQGRFQPSGKRLQLSRQYNVSIDTGAFEIPPSSSRAPDASTLQSVEVRPARKHLHAQPVPCVPVRAFLGWIRARAGTAVPISSRARSLTYACAIALVANMPHAYDDPCRLAHAGTIQQANKCACGLKDACAARFRMVVMGACIATGEQTKCVPWPTWYLATVAMPCSARTN
jgi:hypothetical protein